MRTDMEEDLIENPAFGFPYKSKLMCYIEVYNDGTVNQVQISSSVINRLESGKSKLYCAWPGQWKTDLFKIENITALKKAVYF